MDVLDEDEVTPRTGLAGHKAKCGVQLAYLWLRTMKEMGIFRMVGRRISGRNNEYGKHVVEDWVSW